MSELPRQALGRSEAMNDTQAKLENKQRELRREALLQDTYPVNDPFNGHRDKTVDFTKLPPPPPGTKYDRWGVLRDAKTGRLAKGGVKSLHKPNPFCYKIATLRAAKLAAVSAADIILIMTAAAEKAKTGNIDAARFVFEEVFGPPTAADVLDRMAEMEKALGIERTTPNIPADLSAEQIALLKVNDLNEINGNPLGDLTKA